MAGAGITETQMLRQEAAWLRDAGLLGRCGETGSWEGMRCWY